MVAENAILGMDASMMSLGQRQHGLGAWGWLGVASFVGVGLWAGVRWPKGMDCGVCNMAWSRLGVSEIQWE